MNKNKNILKTKFLSSERLDKKLKTFAVLDQMAKSTDDKHLQGTGS